MDDVWRHIVVPMLSSLDGLTLAMTCRRERDIARRPDPGLQAPLGPEASLPLYLQFVKRWGQGEPSQLWFLDLDHDYGGFRFWSLPEHCPDTHVALEATRRGYKGWLAWWLDEVYPLVGRCKRWLFGDLLLAAAKAGRPDLWNLGAAYLEVNERHWRALRQVVDHDPITLPVATLRALRPMGIRTSLYYAIRRDNPPEKKEAVLRHIINANGPTYARCRVLHSALQHGLFDLAEDIWATGVERLPHEVRRLCEWAKRNRRLLPFLPQVWERRLDSQPTLMEVWFGGGDDEDDSEDVAPLPVPAPDEDEEEDTTALYVPLPEVDEDL